MIKSLWNKGVLEFQYNLFDPIKNDWILSNYNSFGPNLIELSLFKLLDDKKPITSAFVHQNSIYVYQINGFLVIEITRNTCDANNSVETSFKYFGPFVPKLYDFSSAFLYQNDLYVFWKEQNQHYFYIYEEFNFEKVFIFNINL